MRVRVLFPWLGVGSSWWLMSVLRCAGADTDTKVSTGAGTADPPLDAKVHSEGGALPE